MLTNTLTALAIGFVILVAFGTAAYWLDSWMMEETDL